MAARVLLVLALLAVSVELSAALPKLYWRGNNTNFENVKNWENPLATPVTGVVSETIISATRKLTIKANVRGI